MTLNASGIGAMSQAGSISNFASGTYVGDGSGSIQVALGFTPRLVEVRDLTSTPPSTTVWMEGFPTGDTVTNISSTTALNTGSLIVTNAAIVTVTEVAPYGEPPGTGAPGEGTSGTVSVSYDNPVLASPQLTLATGLNVNAHVYAWYAMG
jgi:hypothetical protein